MLVEVTPSTGRNGIQILVADAQGNESREMRFMAAVFDKINEGFAQHGVKFKMGTYDPGPHIPPPSRENQ